MEQIFRKISKKELSLLKEAIPMITVLIAGADGNIDAKERAWAEKITKIRTYSVPEEYQAFYTEVGSDFQEKLDQMIERFPSDVRERGALINEKLSEVNLILAKLEPKYGALLYKEFKRFARHVATASGGFLGFFAVGSEEAKWIDLPMIDEIIYDEDEDEEEDERE